MFEETCLVGKGFEFYAHGHKKRRSESAHRSKNVCCNLCGKRFKAKSKFERFCIDCKQGNEDYHNYSAYNEAW